MAVRNEEMAKWFEENLKGIPCVKGHLIYEAVGCYHFRARTSHGQFQSLNDVRRDFELWLNKFAAIGFNRNSVAQRAQFKVPEDTQGSLIGPEGEEILPKEKVFCFYAKIPSDEVVRVVADAITAGSSTIQSHTGDPSLLY